MGAESDRESVHGRKRRVRGGLSRSWGGELHPRRSIGRTRTIVEGINQSGSTGMKS